MDRNCKMNTVNNFDSKLYRLKNVGKGVGEGGRRWEIIKTNAQRPLGREEHAGVLYKGKYYISGGKLWNKEATDDLWQLNLSNMKWKPLRRGAKERHLHQMWAAKDKLYVLGGRTKVYKREVNGAMDFLNPSIEEFVTFDLSSRTWESVDVFGPDRPYNISEFVALPLYLDDNADDPTSVIVWGGYVEHDSWSDEFQSCQSQKEWLEKVYGKDWEEFSLPYLSRLVRFDLETNVWKNLKPTTEILPKAMSFAAFDRDENGVLRLLVGAGYGYNPSCLVHNKEKQLEKRAMLERLAAKGLCQLPPEGGAYPQGSNKMYEISITGSFGNAYEVEKMKWCWDVYNLPEEQRPRLKIEVSPRSTSLYNATDVTYEDCLPPPCLSVLPNDQKTLLGVRVRLVGLQGRRDLNGAIGRCGIWLGDQSRYQVFVRNEAGSTASISAKPTNLQVVGEPITRDELFAALGKEKKFPRVNMSVLAEVDEKAKLVRPLLDTILESPHGMPTVNLFFDFYYGPVSRQAQAILRTVGTSDDSDSGVLRFNFVPKTLLRVGSGAGKGCELYAQFVKQLVIDDSMRVGAFEREIATVDDSTAKSFCGPWLKIEVQLDGLDPPVSREIIVRPELTMRELHEVVLCAAMGWTPNYHSYAFRRMNRSSDPDSCPQIIEGECWIGPKKSTSLDHMFMPLYIGGAVANDKKISLGQLFAFERGEEAEAMDLQYVHDYGDWWSHSIHVSKYDKDSIGGLPIEAGTVAYLLRGEGGSLVDDVGGALGWCERVGKLTGRNVDPSDEEWWSVLNEKVRQKSNKLPLLTNPLEFNLEATRAAVADAVRRPLAKSGRESVNHTSHDSRTGLKHEFNARVVAPLPKNRTKLCAVCGVTIALKLCSRCSQVAYCSREHQLEHWQEHKSECKKSQAKKKSG